MGKAPTSFDKYASMKTVLVVIFIIYAIFFYFYPNKYIVVVVYYFVFLGLYDFIGALYFKRALLPMGSSKKDYKLIGLSTMFLQFSIAAIIFLGIRNVSSKVVPITLFSIGIGIPVVVSIWRKIK